MYFPDERLISDLLNMILMGQTFPKMNSLDAFTPTSTSTSISINYRNPQDDVSQLSKTFFACENSDWSLYVMFIFLRHFKPVFFLQ